MNETEANALCKTIGAMPRNNHIEILRILKRDSGITLNDNKSGVYVNLAEVPTTTLMEIKRYTEYISDQEKKLREDELKKEEYRQLFSQRGVPMFGRPAVVSAAVTDSVISGQSH